MNYSIYGRKRQKQKKTQTNKVKEMVVEDDLGANTILNDNSEVNSTALKKGGEDKISEF
jgi:hypothetical protein